MSAAPISTVVGNVYHSVATFTDDDTPPNLIDPVSVVFVARSPAGVVTEHTYGDGADPYPVVRLSIGVYEGFQPLLTAGNWFCRWEGVGALMGAVESQVTVRPSRVRVP